MFLNELITEKKAQEKPKKPIYMKEWSPQEPFPDDTVAILKREIHKGAKDLTKEWKGAIELVDQTFKDWKVPKPGCFLKARWDQYTDLLSIAIDALGGSRGYNGKWRST